MYRQGDIIFIPTRTIPKSARPKGDNVVAEGEVTGHFHRAVAVAEVDTVELFTAADGVRVADEVDLWLRTSGPTTITHDEHAPIPLPAGTYRVVRQREFDPAADRLVVD